VTPGSSPDQRPSDGVTELLLECRGGRREVLDRIFPLIYDELRRVASIQLRRESPGHTLSTTALVHEAYLRLVDVSRMEWHDRVHFLSMASRAMRRVLIDHARRHQADRRGSGAAAVTLEEDAVPADAPAEELVALDDALQRLADLSPRLVSIVECRYFGGMTEEETAAALSITSRTVRRDWVKARGWLRHALDVTAS
jgi:RNA polymerase sigma factor (TIGR02999 family)